MSLRSLQPRARAWLAWLHPHQTTGQRSHRSSADRRIGLWTFSSIQEILFDGRGWVKPCRSKSHIPEKKLKWRQTNQGMKWLWLCTNQVSWRNCWEKRQLSVGETAGKSLKSRKPRSRSIELCCITSMVISFSNKRMVDSLFRSWGKDSIQTGSKTDSRKASSGYLEYLQSPKSVWGNHFNQQKCTPSGCLTSNPLARINPSVVNPPLYIHWKYIYHAAMHDYKKGCSIRTSTMEPTKFRNGICLPTRSLDSGKEGGTNVARRPGSTCC